MSQNKPQPRFAFTSADVSIMAPSPQSEEELMPDVDSAGTSTINVQVKIPFNSPANPTAFSAKLYPGFLVDGDLPSKPPKDATALVQKTVIDPFEANVPTISGFSVIEANTQQTLVVWPNNGGELQALKLNITQASNFVNITAIKPGISAAMKLDGTVSVSVTCADSNVIAIFAKIYPGTIEGASFPIAADAGSVSLPQDAQTPTLYTGDVDACAVSAANTPRTLVIWPSGNSVYTLWYHHFTVT